MQGQMSRNKYVNKLSWRNKIKHSRDVCSLSVDFLLIPYLILNIYYLHLVMTYCMCNQTMLIFLFYWWHVCVPNKVDLWFCKCDLTEIRVMHILWHYFRKCVSLQHWFSMKYSYASLWNLCRRELILFLKKWMLL